MKPVTPTDEFFFLNIREDRKRRHTNLHSITIEIKKATS